MMTSDYTAEECDQQSKLSDRASNGIFIEICSCLIAFVLALAEEYRVINIDSTRRNLYF